MSELTDKVNKSVKLLRTISKAKGGEIIELSYSGGKDSDVILRLAQLAGIPYRAIYKNTTIDPMGTVAHCKAAGAEIIRPKRTFFQIIEAKGFPSRFARFCCSELKEYKILDTSIQGIRRDESRARLDRYKEPVTCRNCGKGEHVDVILPILDWTLADVAEFIKSENILCAPVYYDEEGNFCPERRLGCMGCPMASRRKRIEEFRKHPKLARAWIHAGQRWFDNRKGNPTKSMLKFKDAYEIFAFSLLCNNYEEFIHFKRGLFGETDCKQFLEDYLKTRL